MVIDHQQSIYGIKTLLFRKTLEIFDIQSKHLGNDYEEVLKSSIMHIMFIMYIMYSIYIVYTYYISQLILNTLCCYFIGSSLRSTLLSVTVLTAAGQK